MEDIPQSSTLCVPRPSKAKDPHAAVVATAPFSAQIPSNFVLIKIDRFGFSANNVTYQALGEHPHFRYFDFHPAPDVPGVSSPSIHGVIPVWGFGTIARSSHPKIHEGERVYGYFATSQYILVPVSPNDVNKHSFYVPRPHLPPDRRPYNQIIRCASDPQYNPTPIAEDLAMLYRPLFWTSFWCEDWIATSDYRGHANRVLVTSASSKTAFCLAYLMRKRHGDNIRIVGLTSMGNLGFTKGLELYHDVLDYDTFASADALQAKEDNRWIYVDVAGNEELTQRILARWSSQHTGQLAAWISLGATNLSPSQGAASLDWKANTSLETPTSSTPSGANNTPVLSHPQCEHFFMPEWLDVRKRQLSLAEIFTRQNQAWKELMVDCEGWVNIKRTYGAEEVKDAYLTVARGGLGPDAGLIWSMWDKGKDLMSKL
ncbi:hypothetical protein BD779DRAFT_1439025 [Infundibulicybe gibba]|nr:hypothetical protein BD779DRAFT_1439025 [Infundibulicybe gibba]